MRDYQTYTNVFGEQFVTWENEDGSRSWMPQESDNEDHAAYLKWIAEGNTPEPWQPDSES